MFSATTFDKYFLTRRIAVGGMAEVYQAKLYGADGFEKDLVIKQILPQHAQDPQFVRSFVTEAKIAVGLSHPNIVAVYELGKAEGTYFIAMEYVDGLDALQLLRADEQTPIPVPVALHIGLNIARGLAYAHQALGPDGKPLGLVHRDLNPRNVLVSKGGEVKILDFGIAKVEAEHLAVPRTRAGVVKGTLGYMAPEQAAGRPVDGRTDLYQCAVVLWELLAGEHLFWQPDDRQIQDRVDRHVVPLISERRSDVSPEIDELLQASLTREPQDRLAGAEVFADKLSDLLRTDHPGFRQTDLSAYVRQVAAKIEATRQENVENLPETPDVAALITRPVTREVSDAGQRNEEIRSVIEEKTLQSKTDNVSNEPPPPEKKSKRALWLGLGLIMFASALWFINRDSEVSTPKTPLDAGQVAMIEPPPPVIEATTATTAIKVAVPPVAPPTKIIRPTKRKVPPPKAAVPVLVDLGTRSCSARVVVDGVLLTKTTPSFGHRLSPGPHRFTFEGVGCSGREAAGSLANRVPVVSQGLTLTTGRVQVIADFKAERVLMRPRSKE